MNIATKFGFNWTSGFREENKNVSVYGRRLRLAQNDDNIIMTKFFNGSSGKLKTDNTKKMVILGHKC